MVSSFVCCASFWLPNTECPSYHCRYLILRILVGGNIHLPPQKLKRQDTPLPASIAIRALKPDLNQSDAFILDFESGHHDTNEQKQRRICSGNGSINSSRSFQFPKTSDRGQHRLPIASGSHGSHILQRGQHCFHKLVLSMILAVVVAAAHDPLFLSVF